MPICLKLSSALGGKSRLLVCIMSMSARTFPSRTVNVIGVRTHSCCDLSKTCTSAFAMKAASLPKSLVSAAFNPVGEPPGNCAKPVKSAKKKREMIPTARFTKPIFFIPSILRDDKAPAKINQQIFATKFEKTRGLAAAFPFGR